jgi:A/G-specific adenine glycosylase
VIEWWEANARRLPWRATRDVYAVWVSEAMSTQTAVSRAARAWVPWMARWPTVQALAGASLAEVLAQWQGLGYPRRARDLHRSARIVVETGWPEDLTELPGVGAYVAAAIRCFAREEPVLPLDVNVRRVRSRHRRGSVASRAGDHGVRPAHLRGPSEVRGLPGERRLRRSWDRSEPAGGASSEAV